ncbi:MAG TPA: ABC transporter permease [Gemmatimonadales bacterium]|jgi:predicted permease
MFLYAIRHAARRLIREPGFTLAVVLTLALGVGANVTVFALVEAVLLRPLPYRDTGRLVTLNHRDERTGITKPYNALGDVIDFAGRRGIFDAFGAYGTGEATVFGQGDPFRVSALVGTAGAFAALGVRPILGRAIRPEDCVPGAGPVMLLGYDLWRERFGGDSAVVGRTVKIDDQQRLVVGVAEPGFRFPPGPRTDVLAAMTLPVQPPEQRRSGWLMAVGRLAPGRTVADAGSEIATLSKQFERAFPQSNQASGYFLLPLRDALVGNTKQALVLLLSAVSVVLLIACVNVANLLVARSLSRRREMAVRMALGAGRRQLGWQLLAESLVLALVAGAVGLGLAHWGSKALVALVPQSVDVPVEGGVRLDGIVLGFTLFLCVATALVFAFVAALTFRLETSLGTLVVAGRASMSARARRAMGGLVMGEIAFAVVLLIGAGLILRTFTTLLAVDPGFRYDHVMTLDLVLPADRYAADDARRGFYDHAFAAVRAVPGVRDIGAGVVVPLTGNNWTLPFERTDQPVAPGERAPDVGWQVASSGFFRALEIPLVSGRLFEAGDKPGSPPVAIVSQAVERRFFGGGSAVGGRFKLGDQTVEIVGVVGDIRRAGFSDEPRADLYLPFEQALNAEITLFVRTSGVPEQSLAGIKTAIRGIEPEAVVASTRTMAEVAHESVQITRLVLWLLAAFAATALVLAAVGIYGVMSYVVGQRSREIGTRIALGAAPRDILWMVLRQGAIIAATGTAAGVAIGLLAARSLRSILYGVSSADPLILIGAAATLVATALVACWLPARRAVAVDPARTLSDD